MARRVIITIFGIYRKCQYCRVCRHIRSSMKGNEISGIQRLKGIYTCLHAFPVGLNGNPVFVFFRIIGWQRSWDTVALYCHWHRMGPIITFYPVIECVLHVRIESFQHRFADDRCWGDADFPNLSWHIIIYTLCRETLYCTSQYIRITDTDICPVKISGIGLQTCQFCSERASLKRSHHLKVT